MDIINDLAKYTVAATEPLSTALTRMSSVGNPWVVVVDDGGVLVGVLTDGDVRRWLLSERGSGIDTTVYAVIGNGVVVTAHESDSPADISSLLNSKIRFVPLLDNVGRVKAVACDRPRSFEIAGHLIGDDQPVFIVAEIGNNHQGRLSLARDLVDAAVAAGADCVKFQMRTMDELYIDQSARQRQGTDLGAEYAADLLARFQLSDADIFAAMDYAEQQGVVALCTPWDMRSMQKLADRGVAGFKVASADLTNHPFLRLLARTGLPLIVSTGMSEEREVRAAVNVLEAAGASFMMLHCNSTYPAMPEHVQLHYIDHLRDLTGRPVGYSGHERGIAISIGAVALGAAVVERHITIDKSLEGNDHRASLDPAEFTQLVEGIRAVKLGLGQVGWLRSMSQGERLNRETLGKSLVAGRAIAAGAVVTIDDLEVRSPGRGISAAHMEHVTRFTASRDLAPGDYLYPSDLDGSQERPRTFSFHQPWGIPVRFHDVDQLVAGSNVDFVEFHLSYRDLDVDVSAKLRPSPLNFVVHAPELFYGDHIMDLASRDVEYRRRSIAELRRVVSITRRIRDLYSSSGPTGIVVNVGGVSEDARDPQLGDTGYQRVADALAEASDPDVEFWIQTMPPFPWHFGGQRFHNLFVAPNDIGAFCERYGYRLCLDVSHTALASKAENFDLYAAVDQLALHVKHLHLSDAEGVTAEGLQIGDGDVDFERLGAALSSANYSFIPEVWQGHKDRGAGFWEALARLERMPAFSQGPARKGGRT